MCKAKLRTDNLEPCHTAHAGLVQVMQCLRARFFSSPHSAHSLKGTGSASRLVLAFFALDDDDDDAMCLEVCDAIVEGVPAPCSAVAVGVSGPSGALPPSGAARFLLMVTFSPS